MPGDTPRTDGAQQRAVYNGYTKLMETPCAGHALFEPIREGALGDGGYIDRGRFVKEFNIYEHSGIVRTPAPEQRKERTADALWPYAMPLVSSHHTELAGELAVEIGENVVAPINVNPKVTLNDDEYAMLHAYKPKRKDSMNRGEIESVGDWLFNNRVRIRSNTLVLTSVVRASGWVALYSSVRQQSASLMLGLGSRLLGVLGKGTYNHADAKKVMTKGPEDWVSGDSANADHTVIVGYVRALSRWEYFVQTRKILPLNPSYDSAPDGPDMPNAPGGQGGANASANASSASSSTASFTTAMTSHSLATGDEIDMDLLYPILAAALEKQQDLDVVAADTSIIFDFLHRHERLPDPIHDSIVIDVRERGGPPAERVGWISEVDAVNDGDHTAVIDAVESVNLAEAAPVPSASDMAPIAVGAISNSHIPTYSLPQFGGASAFAQNLNSIPPPRPVEPSQSSTDMGGSVQALNNHYQANGLLPSQYVTYSQAIPLGRDQVAISVFLLNYDPPRRFDGNGVGKHNAKESAARKALDFVRPEKSVE